MSLYHYNGTDIICVSQTKPEHSFGHARSCVYITFSEFCQPGNADHRMIYLTVVWLIRLLHCYIAMYMTIYWLLASKALVCLKLICQVMDSK